MNQLAVKSNLIKLYHTLASKLNMTGRDRLTFMAGWGVTTSKDLSIEELQEACQLLRQQLNGKGDKWRKRVMAAIFGYMQLTGRQVSPDYVKAMACRSAGAYKFFNDIPVSKLITIYYAFLDKQKVLKRTGELMSDDLDLMQFRN